MNFEYSDSIKQKSNQIFHFSPEAPDHLHIGVKIFKGFIEWKYPITNYSFWIYLNVNIRNTQSSNINPLKKLNKLMWKHLDWLSSLNYYLFIRYRSTLYNLNHFYLFFFDSFYFSLDSIVSIVDLLFVIVWNDNINNNRKTMNDAELLQT